MTMLYASQGTITFPIAAGNTLLINNISGTELVGSSTVVREDVSSVLGSGRVAYGPQTSAVTLTLSTSGQCDYEIRVGDVAPSRDALKVDPITGGADSAAMSALNASAATYPLIAGLNWKASNTSRLRLALQQAGIRRGMIVGLFDSYGIGRKAGGSADVNGKQFAWPKLLANALNAAGYLTTSDSVVGWGNVTPATAAGYQGYDPRVVSSAGVTFQTGTAGPGYQNWKVPATETIVFTPGDAFDTLDIYWPAQAGNGTFTVSDGGGVKATIDTSATPGTEKAQTITLAAGTTSVTITGTVSGTNGGAMISGWKPRIAANPGVELVPVGASGNQFGPSFTPTAASTPFGVQAFVQLITSGITNCCVIGEGWYNDYKIGGRTQAQYAADLRSVITWVKGLGFDYVHVNYAKLDPAQVDEKTFQSWTGLVKSIVIGEFDCPWVDVSLMIPDNAAAVADSIMDPADKLHLQKPGHQIACDTIMRYIRSVMA